MLQGLRMKEKIKIVEQKEHTVKKILAVDDEAGIRSLLKESLEMEGYLVYTAKNGMEAMESLKYQPDLIIMDINMPGMDGYTVCEKIRDYVDCPILFLTARTEEQDRVNGFKSGGGAVRISSIFIGSIFCMSGWFIHSFMFCVSFLIARIGLIEFIFEHCVIHLEHLLLFGA